MNDIALHILRLTMMLRTAGAASASATRSGKRSAAPVGGSAAPMKGNDALVGKAAARRSGRSAAPDLRVVGKAAAIGRSGGKGDGGGSGRAGKGNTGSPTGKGGSGGKRGGRVESDAMLLPMSPNTRARTAAAMSSMSPNTRAHTASAMLSMSPNTRPRAAGGTNLFAVLPGERDSGSTGAAPKKRSAEDQSNRSHAKKSKPAAVGYEWKDSGESPATTARREKAWRANQTPQAPVFEVNDDDESYKDEDVAHGSQFTEFGQTFHLDAAVKDFIFPSVKFANKDVDLKFSNQQHSICRVLAEKLQIPDDEVEDWWDCQATRVHNQLKAHRNNTIKGIKKIFQGKKCDVHRLLIHHHLLTQMHHSKVCCTGS